MRREQDERHVADDLRRHHREEPKNDSLPERVIPERRPDDIEHRLGDARLPDAVDDHEEPSEKEEQDPIHALEHEPRGLARDEHQEGGAGHGGPREVHPGQERRDHARQREEAETGEAGF